MSKKILILSSIIFLISGIVWSIERKEEAFQDIKKNLPKVYFSNLENTLSGEKNLEIKVEKVEGIEIESIEIYLRPSSSLVPIFLDRAEKKDEETFLLLFDTTNFPNGNYLIFPKVITNLGEYQREEVAIEIKNEMIQKEGEESEQIKKEVQESQHQLSEEESKAEKVVEDTTKEIENNIEEILKEMPIKIEEEKFEIDSEIKDFKNIIENEVAKEEKEEIIKKERENKKEEIVKKLIQPIEENIAKLEPQKKENLVKKKEEIEKRIKEKLKETELKLAQIAKAKKEISELSFKDSDQDYIPDWKELALGTDPLNPDTDQDGFLDGIEIKYVFDPKKPDPAQKMFFSDPRKSGKISEKLSVEKVEIFEGKLKIIGKGIPKSFVYIYIYSSPIVAMAKINEKGYFEYILEKPLADGTHTIYVVLTNNQGKIEEKSPSFSFVKSGDKILRITELEAKVVPSPSQSLLNLFLIFTIAIVIIAIGIAFIVIGMAIKK